MARSTAKSADTQTGSSQVFDIVVVGGGLSGTAAAIISARAGYSVCHLAPATPVDRRTSALMRPSVEWLKQSGLVSDPDALGVPLTQIRIIDATHRLIRAPETLFDCAEIGIDAFAWNFANAPLLDAWAAQLAKLKNCTRIEASLQSIDQNETDTTLTLSDGQVISCNMLVGADGKKSFVRSAAGISVKEHAFAQSALVCDLELERPLDGASIEFHYENGPFTLVPAGENKTNLVWIDRKEVLEGAKAMSESDFIATLETKSQRIFGTIIPSAQRIIFPLSTLSVGRAASGATVLVGDAAHAFPPIGAQGLNLGLRDVAELEKALLAHTRKSQGWAQQVADDYAQGRAADLRRTSTVVDTLFRSLLSDFLPSQAVRATGLWALKLVPGLRKAAFGVGMGGRT